jgi:hypothetical protein
MRCCSVPMALSSSCPTATGRAPANLEIVLAVQGAGIVVDGLAAVLRPGPDRRSAVAMFAALAPLLTWAGYLGTAAVAAGRLPAVTEFWTGIPIVAALLGWLLAAIGRPNAARV